MSCTTVRQKKRSDMKPNIRRLSRESLGDCGAEIVSKTSTDQFTCY